MRSIWGLVFAVKLTLVMVICTVMFALSVLRAERWGALVGALGLNTARAQPTPAAHHQRTPDAPLPPINLGELEFAD